MGCLLARLDLCAEICLVGTQPGPALGMQIVCCPF